MDLEDGIYYVFGENAPAGLWGRYFAAEDLRRILKDPAAGERDFKRLAANCETQLDKVFISDGREAESITLHDPYDIYNKPRRNAQNALRIENGQKHACRPATQHNAGQKAPGHIWE